MTRTGLPHSEMYGSLPACGSPYLFAAYRVLHRLSMPRQPPYALHNLITFLRLPCLFRHNFVILHSLRQRTEPVRLPRSLIISRSDEKSIGNRRCNYDSILHYYSLSAPSTVKNFLDNC